MWWWGVNPCGDAYVDIWHSELVELLPLGSAYVKAEERMLVSSFYGEYTVTFSYAEVVWVHVSSGLVSVDDVVAHLLRCAQCTLAKYFYHFMIVF